MYNEIELINLIKTKTGFDTDFAPDATVNLLSATTSSAPKVYIGHIGIKLQHPEQLWANGYNELENPEILLTHIQYVCERSSWAETRIAIANAYKGFTPFPFDSDYSSMVFVESSIVATTSTKIWASEVVGIIFPRIS